MQNIDKTHTKILVYTKPENGYPPEEWESLWAKSLGRGLFKIDNIPFYAKNLSYDDIVKASMQDDNYFLEKLITPSRNSTIRVIIYNLEQEEKMRNDFISLGCSIEGSGISGLIALNIPHIFYEKTLFYIEEAFKNEKLDFEVGVVR